MADDVRVTPGPIDTGARLAGLRVSLLGSMQVEFEGRPMHVAGRQRRRLLALLASRPGRVVSVEALIDAMWGDDPPPSVGKTLQSHVVRLRQSLAAAGDPIETSPGGYRLNVDPASTDVTRFERLATEGTAELRLGHFAASAKVLETAIALWRGPALMEFGDASFVVGDRVRLEERRLVALEDLAESLLGTGAAPAVVPEMERVVTEEPGRERAWALLMRALYASGRQHHALAAYQRARAVLGDEFGLEPGRELRDLEQRIIEQDPALIGPGNRAALPAPLRADAPLVGREHELGWLIAAWRRACGGVGQVRAVLGPTGSGRTRLVAELAAAVIVDGGSAEYVSGAAGLHLLAEGTGPGSIIDTVGVRSRGTPLLLVVDNVEWTPPASVDAIRALAAAAEQMTLLLVLIGHPTEGPGIQLIHQLERSCAATLDLAPLSDPEIAAILSGEGVDTEAIDAAVAMAGGLPGIARREAAAWAERTATDRLNVAASISVDARSAAALAGTSVLDEVRRLVEARGRRSALVGPEWTGRQPYRALASYQPADADLFVGRERLVAELTARVLDRRLVAVVGASGSGKSSIVRAGLLPLVRSGRLPGVGPWRADVIVPGADPLATIDAVAGLDEPGPQLLVIDQFEEVLSSGAIDAVAGRLLDLVLDPALDVRVVLVARADQLGALAASRALAELIEDAQVLVGPPSDDELRRIVIEPARRTGCTVEPELVSMIASDVGGHDAALPLVSAAMAAVWERRDGDVLSARSYMELGGLAAAVERLGERALEGVGPSGRGALRVAMLRLVDVTDDGVWVRRRVNTADLPPELGPAIDALVDARLVTRTEETVDVVHEVVFRAWPQMVIWLEEARADLTLERDLRAAARSWDSQERSDDNVLRGGRFQAATEWAARRGDVPQLIAELIAASHDWAERDDRAICAQLAREQRSKRRLRGGLVAASFLLVMALVAGVLFVGQRNEARDATRTTRVRELALQSTLALDIDPELSILLALEAVRSASADRPEPEAIAALQEAVQVSRLELRIPDVDALHLDALPGGDVLVGASFLGPEAIVWDTVSGERLRTLTSPIDPATGDSEGVNGLAFGPHPGLLAVSYVTAGADGTDRDTPVVIVWDPTTGNEVARLIGPSGAYSSPTFSPDGRLVAALGSAVGAATAVTVWDVASGVERFSFEPSGEAVAVTFSPDGGSLIVAEFGSKRIGFYAADDGRAIGSLATPGFAPEGSVVDPTGTRLAVWSQTSRGVRVLDIATREFLRAIPVGDVFVVDWSPDGERLAIASGNQGPVRVVDVESGQDVMVLRGHVTGANDAVFIDGDRLASVGGDLRVWDVSPTGPSDLGAIAAESGVPRDFEISPDGSEVAMFIQGATPAVEFHSTDTGRSVRPPLTGRFELNAVAISPDWRLLASSAADGRGEIHDLRSLALLRQLPACTQPSGFSPDGSLLVLDGSFLCTSPEGGPPLVDAPSGADLRTRVIDVVSNEEILDLGQRQAGGTFNPAGRFAAGRYLAVGVQTDPPGVNLLEIYDVTARQLVASLERPTLLGVSFDPTGRWLLGVGWNGGVWVLDLAAVIEGTPADEALVFDQTTSNGVSRAAISSDGVLATSGNGDGLLRLWNLSTGEPLLQFRTDQTDGPAVGRGWMKFSPDGSYLLYQDSAGVLRRHLLDTDRLIELAKARLTRGFTPDECRSYLDSTDCG